MMLIGLAGPVGVGKKTAAAYLHGQYGFERVCFFETIAHVLRTTRAWIVFDNLRVDYEAESIRSAGGQVWHIQRPFYLARQSDTYKGIEPKGPDRGLLNDGPVHAFYNRIDRLIEDLLDKVKQEERP